MIFKTEFLNKSLSIFLLQILSVYPVQAVFINAFQFVSASARLLKKRRHLCTFDGVICCSFFAECKFFHYAFAHTGDCIFVASKDPKPFENALSLIRTVLVTLRLLQEFVARAHFHQFCLCVCSHAANS